MLSVIINHRFQKAFLSSNINVNGGLINNKCLLLGVGNSSPIALDPLNHLKQPQPKTSL